MQDYQNNQYNKNINSYNGKNTGTLGLAILLFILTLAFGIGSIIVVSKKGAYNSRDLDNFAVEQYNEIYNDSYQNHSDYSTGLSFYGTNSKPQNALVVLVVYPNEKNYDIKCKNSGNLNTFSDYDFGEKYNSISNDFKGYLTNNASYGSDVMKYLAKAIESNNTSYKSFYSTQYGNSNLSKIVNKTNSQLNGEAELKKAINTYHSLTQVNVSVVIAESIDIYGVNYFLFVAFLIPALCCAVGLIKVYKIFASERRMLVEYNGGPNVKTSGIDSTIDLDSDKDPFEEYYKNQNNK